jgi:class 3 adenylate cyclase
VFSDVTGSTALGEGRDPEAIRGVMNRYFATARGVLERHGGTVEKFVGDAVMAAFGIPVVHEDDALRAVRAALEMQHALKALNDDLETEFGVRIAIRTGVNTGEVVAGDASARETFATGDTVNTAARLEQAAPPGEVLLGESTYRLVRNAVVVEPVEPLSLKGKASPVPAYRLLEVMTPAQAPPRASGTPMVGRQAETALLHQAFDRAVKDRACQLVTLLGEAGVGKSRLISEFLRSVENEATVLRGRCLSYGAGITFFPVVEVMKQAAGITESDSAEEARARLLLVVEEDEAGPQIAALVEALLGISESAGSIEETFWAVRKVLETTSRVRPVVVVLEDLHWAEPTLLDLISHVVTLATDAQLLLLCTSRPDLLAARPDWGEDVPRSIRIDLGPLSEAETEELIGAALSGAGIPRPFIDRITQAGEGNPLFLEETLSMLKDDGLLTEQDGRWVATGDLEALDIPPSISALLESRIGALEAGERELVGRASVVGKEFDRSDVEAVCDEAGQRDLGPRLAGLRSRDLIVQEPSALEAYSFRHVLIRDAAYRGMAKRLRAELHERFAVWLESGAEPHLTELEEIIGYHFEQAYRFRAELGPVTEHALALAERAGGHLALAGHRALARGDLPAGVSLLTRASDLREPEDAARLEILSVIGAALIELGERERADRVLKEATEEARRSGDRRIEWLIKVPALEQRLATDTGFPVERALAGAEQAVAVFEEMGDDRGLTDSLILVGQLRSWLGQEVPLRRRSSERSCMPAESVTCAKR